MHRNYSFFSHSTCSSYSGLASDNANAFSQNAVAPQTLPLPPGWGKAIDQQSGQCCYHNTQIAQSRWEQPLPTPSQRPPYAGTALQTKLFHAMDKGLPAKKHPAIASQIAVCNKYKKGKVLEKDVLIATTAALKKCSLADAFQCMERLKAVGVASNVITYSALISACEKAGRADQVQLLLQNAVSSGVFRETLGYCAEQNTLNLHANSVYEEYIPYQHEPGVHASVARALFQHHWDQGHIKAGTGFIVGCHGNGLLKKAIQECLEERGMDSVTEWSHDGKPNDGRLIAMHSKPVSQPVPQSLFNLEAPPFKPAWKN